MLDVIGATLIFAPRWTRYGATVIACTTGTATALALFKPALPLGLPLIFMLLAIALASLAPT